MKIKQYSLGFLGIALLVAGFSSCKKDASDFLTVPETGAHFVGGAVQTYTITSATAPPYKLTIGTTDVSASDRTVTFTVSSPTGAVKGTQYNFTGNSVTIPAGQATATVDIQGVFSQYTTGRKDTLIFTITEPNTKAADFDNTMKLVLRGPCAETDIVLSEFIGTYANTNELFGTSAYGPYTTTISAVNQTSPTSGTITVTNIYNENWSPATFTLDWSNPANRTITLVSQVVGGNAGLTFGAAYNGMPNAIRPVPVSLGGQVGTFS
jgi:hypothetical protein